MKLLNNNILLRAVHDGTERQYKNTGLIIGISKVAKDNYLKNYTKRHFEVVQVPEELIFPTSREEFAESGYAFRYRTNMDLLPGDIVWGKLRSAHGAQEVKVSGEKLYLVHYADLFVAQRLNTHRTMGDSKPRIVKDERVFDIIPLNGLVVCDKMLKDKDGLKFKEEEELGRLKIRYAGTPSLSYFSIVDDKFVEVDIPPFKLRPGDVIQADGPYINVEGEYFHDFNGESQPVVIHPTSVALVL